jgi:hypothetical protein
VLLYTLGPMSDMEDHNAPAFRETAEILRGLGHEAISPVEMDEAEGFDFKRKLTEAEYAAFLGRDIEKIAALGAAGKLDGGVALDGWERSRGAAAEAHVIRALGRPIYRLVPVGASIDHWELELLQDSIANRHPGSEHFHAILRDLGALHDRKQQDYGRVDDPFANVRSAADWGVPEWVGGMIRATDKVRRLQTFAQRGTLANEGVVDAFNDLAVYAIICRVLYEQSERAPEAPR